MKHILFIDPLEKLNPKKDTSLMVAATMKAQGIDVKLLFEKDFYLSNKMNPEFIAYDFEAEFYEDGCYIKRFELKSSLLINLERDDVIHMRIDPPFDTRYLRYLWMLRFYQEKGIRIVNSPDGILKFNEKLHAYIQPSSLATYVGSSVDEFLKFSSLLRKEHHTEMILKPLDLYQGIGVEKVNLDRSDLADKFKSKVAENNGPIVAQPFCKDVVNGEIRALYFKGIELGSILKVPKSGEFLANIAQGAAFHPIELGPKIKDECNRICNELLRDGVDFVAFDIMGDHISEINITCPGLLVEVSFAHKKNLALHVLKLL
jgi:glutathione synthase